MLRDREYISRCIELAGNAIGSVSPNPLVGSVIVSNGKIIGEGFHKQYGDQHAEVVAINRVKSKELLLTSTLYVNLEPCCHYGKTPPCTDLIISRKIPRVVIGSLDYNPAVSGCGAETLKKAGVDVITGVAEEESKFLNRRFFTFHVKRRPYIILKWAKTKDDFIDISRESDKAPYINWITNPILRLLVHRWRHEEDAICAGANTVLNDDPELTTRYWPGNSPVRVIIDYEGVLTNNQKVFRTESPVLLFTAGKSKVSRSNVKVFNITGTFYETLYQVMQNLYSLNIQSIIVEGGAQLLNTFLKMELWDEARVFTGNKYFETGLPSPVIDAKPQELLHFDRDILEIYYK